jgi:hypothetical protein
LYSFTAAAAAIVVVLRSMANLFVPLGRLAAMTCCGRDSRVHAEVTFFAFI